MLELPRQLGMRSGSNLVKNALIHFFCNVMAGVQDSAIDADECEIAGTMLAEGNSQITEFRHPTELWLDEAETTAISINLIICRNRWLAGYFIKYPDSKGTLKCALLLKLMKERGIGE